jgi:hypothetical protein
MVKSKGEMESKEKHKNQRKGLLAALSQQIPLRNSSLKVSECKNCPG